MAARGQYWSRVLLSCSCKHYKWLMFAHRALPSTTARLRLHVPLTVTLTLTSVTDYSGKFPPSGM
eukprot:765962-Hanusia_phi.AAC.1